MKNKKSLFRESEGFPITYRNWNFMYQVRFSSENKNYNSQQILELK